MTWCCWAMPPLLHKGRKGVFPEIVCAQSLLGGGKTEGWPVLEAGALRDQPPLHALPAFLFATPVYASKAKRWWLGEVVALLQLMPDASDASDGTKPPTLWLATSGSIAPPDRTACGTSAVIRCCLSALLLYLKWCCSLQRSLSVINS